MDILKLVPSLFSSLGSNNGEIGPGWQVSACLLATNIYSRSDLGKASVSWYKGVGKRLRGNHKKMRGTWIAQSVEPLTFGFSFGHDLKVLGSISPPTPQGSPLSVESAGPSAAPLVQQ